jgi:hypothetical protein
MQNNKDKLVNLYQELYGPEISMANLNDLASDLSQIAGRNQPWTGKYIHSLIKGYPGFKANGQLMEALTVLSSRYHGDDEVQARAKEATVLSVSNLPVGTMILGQARRCATPGCQVRFVPTHPRQKYHSKTCAKIGRRTRHSS